MRVCKIDVGGNLQTGDLIGVAYANYIVYGWFIPDGESLMFITLNSVKYAKDRFDEWEQGANTGSTNLAWLSKRFGKGFTYKCIARDYIVAWGNNRVFKVQNPEEFFAGSSNEQLYLVTRQILQDLKFPAR